MCESELKGIFDGLVGRGGERFVDSSSSLTVIDASSMVRSRYSLTILFFMIPTVSGMAAIIPSSCTTDSTIVSGTVFVWTRLPFLA